MTRAHAKSFYFASHALPWAKRRAAYAVYAFCRYVDDQVDLAPESGCVPEVIAELRVLVRDVEEGRFDGKREALPWLEAYAATVRDYRIPIRYFLELLEGVAMDQGPVRLRTWEDLHRYCYHVASVVGLVMTAILTGPGPTPEELVQPAKDLGTAMQLTNILRDVGEDWERGRVYLPASELAQFGVSEADLASGRVTEDWRSLIRFQIERARDYYRRSEEGIRRLPADGSQFTVWMMRGIYAAILDEIEAAGDDVFTRRASVSLGRKCLLALQAWRRQAVVAV